MRAALDVNILIAALLSGRGAPAELIRRWLGGELELVVSPLLLDELERALTHPKLRRRISADEGNAFVALLRTAAIGAADPAPATRRSSDPEDDYLLALAEHERAFLVSGDRHLLLLAGELPILSARELLDELDPSSR